MRLRISAAVGAVAVLVGLLVSIQQGFAGLIPVTWAFVLLLAAVAAIQTVNAGFTRRSTPILETETGDPERRYEAPAPGDDLAETLALARRRSRAGDRPRDRVRDRVADAAVAAVVDVEGCSTEAAQDRVRHGEWTDDPVAAWFLGTDVPLPRSERARLLATSPFSQFDAAFERTVRAIDRLDDHGGGR